LHQHHACAHGKLRGVALDGQGRAKVQLAVGEVHASQRFGSRFRAARPLAVARDPARLQLDVGRPFDGLAGQVDRHELGRGRVLVDPHAIDHQIRAMVRRALELTGDLQGRQRRGERTGAVGPERKAQAQPIAKVTEPFAPPPATLP